MPQAGEPNGSKGTQVADVTAIATPQDGCREGVPQPGMDPHAGFAGRESPLADDEIGPAFQDRIHEPPYLAGRAEIVGVHEHEDSGGSGPAPDLANAGQTGPTVTRPGRRHDDGTAPGRDRGRAVGRSVVDHHRPIDPCRVKSIEQAGEAGSLVSCRNEDGYAFHLSRGPRCVTWA